MYRIMVVDDNVTNLLTAKAVLEDAYEVLTAPSGRKALELCAKLKKPPDLMLLDIIMPDMNGYEVISAMKSDPVLKNVVVIFLTANNDVKSELEGLTLGAVDYITKPFSPHRLTKRIELHLKLIESQRQLEEYNKNLQDLVDLKTQNITQLQYAIIYSIADLIEKKDGYTGGHTERVRQYLEILLRQIVAAGIEPDLHETDIAAIALSSRLHDVGKIAIPDDVLLKPGKLTEDEFENIKGHSMYGYDSILKSLMSEDDVKIMQAHTVSGAESIVKSMHFAKDNIFLTYALNMAKSHHEKWDGSGYPDGLKGEMIPFIARALAICDVYDALRSIRPYKTSFAHDLAVEIIKKDCGISFDPKLVEQFLLVEAEFAVASEQMQSAVLA